MVKGLCFVDICFPSSIVKPYVWPCLIGTSQLSTMFFHGFSIYSIERLMLSGWWFNKPSEADLWCSRLRGADLQSGLYLANLQSSPKVKYRQYTIFPGPKKWYIITYSISKQGFEQGIDLILVVTLVRDYFQTPRADLPELGRPQTCCQGGAYRIFSQNLGSGKCTPRLYQSIGIVFCLGRVGWAGVG